MHTTEKHLETNIMELRDVAAKFGNVIVELQEYQSYSAAERHLQNDKQA